MILKAYASLNCVDVLWYCYSPTYKAICNKGYKISGAKLEDLCPYTCGKCKSW